MASSPVVVARRQNSWARTIARLSHEYGARLLVALLLGLVSVLAFVYLTQASYVAQQIDDMVKLESTLTVLNEENSALLLDIAKYEEMPRIKNEARAMGLGEAKQVEYVEVFVDDAGASPVGDMVDEGSSSNGGGQQSIPFSGEATAAAGGLRLAPTIVQQFQSWIGIGTTGRDTR